MSVDPAIRDTTSAAAIEPASATTLSPELRSPEHPVIFFDGVCGLCNHWIDFILARDRKQQFRFSPLQGETARDCLGAVAAESLSSVVLRDATGTYRKTDAVWRMLTRLGGIWWCAGGLLRLVPQPIRNGGYDFVARHRYRWFGQKETCRLPTPAERARFLP
jgi:predicted DCC family thiol-disulfide oxidoreductase YuxK